VKNKLEKGDGMSFAEFTYPLLQAWDWWHMYETKGIQLQIGGADQYGNIIAGIDAIKYISSHHSDPDVREGKETPLMEPMGFTVPLLTTSTGDKFGKSAGNAVWLDKAQTSTFDLYGFFVRQSDADVGRYLRLFTFLPIPEIESVLAEHAENPKLRKAQHLLAREFLELIHGPEEAKAAELQHRLLHATGSTASPKIDEDPASSIPEQITLNNAPIANIKLPHSLIHTKPIARILHAAGLVASAADGHRAVAAGGVYIGGRSGQKAPMPEAALMYTPIKNWVVEDTAKFLVDDKLLILRKGKHNIRIVEVVSDEEWEKSGMKYPGEKHVPVW
jgi:tyrosyl-tRNA synthetase